MNIGQIFYADSANGPGVRVSVFVSGCLNHCPGCFQPETWDFAYGHLYTEEMEAELITELNKPYYRGISILGGDPMEEKNQPEVAALLRRVKEECPGRDIWVYTGYLYERDLVPGGKRHFGQVTEEILSCVDILVDGPFVEAQKNLTLNFRGSENQRIIDVRKSRESGEIVLDPRNEIRKALKK